MEEQPTPNSQSDDEQFGSKTSSAVHPQKNKDVDESADSHPPNNNEDDPEMIKDSIMQKPTMLHGEEEELKPASLRHLKKPMGLPRASQMMIPDSPKRAHRSQIISIDLDEDKRRHKSVLLDPKWKAKKFPK